jgi:CheY-like chemotaxis protein
VDDDPEIRLLYGDRLRKAGLDVSEALNGEQGFHAAVARFPDLVLSDIEMPVLDGWGMLRRLKSDHRTREIPVVFLSGVDDFRETLRAARSGAHDYLPKALRPDEVVGRAVSVLGAKVALYLDLSSRRLAPIDLGLVGPQWLLRALETLRASGVLDLTDDWGAYQVVVREGAIVDATTTIGERSSSDVGALASLLVSRGARGQFRPGTTDGKRRLQGSTPAILESVCERLNRIESQVIGRRLQTTSELVVDEALFQLFGRFASDAELRVARAVRDEHVRASDLTTHLGLAPEEVERSLRELLRRRVIQFASST